MLCVLGSAIEVVLFPHLMHTSMFRIPCLGALSGLFFSLSAFVCLFSIVHCSSLGRRNWVDASFIFPSFPSRLLSKSFLFCSATSSSSPTTNTNTNQGRRSPRPRPQYRPYHHRLFLRPGPETPAQCNRAWEAGGVSGNELGGRQEQDKTLAGCLAKEGGVRADTPDYVGGEGEELFAGGCEGYVLV